MQFTTECGVPLAGRPIFRYSDYSFGFEVAEPDVFDQRVGDGVTSVLVRSLQIDVAVPTGQALFVWGYHPHLTWQVAPVAPADPRPGAVRVQVDEALLPDVGYKIPNDESWMTVRDPTSGWVRVRPQTAAEDEQAVLIAEGTCLGLIKDQLNTIWIRPTFLA